MNPVAETIKVRFPHAFVRAAEFRGDLAVEVKREGLLDVAHYLREDPGMDYDYIVHVSSVDWLGEPVRFEVVWEVYSVIRRHRIRIKTRVPESDPVVESLTLLWKGAEFMEREVYDMMGIRFAHHPDLRRILMPDEYTEGYPLRKDFPLVGKGWRDTFEFIEGGSVTLDVGAHPDKARRSSDAPTPPVSPGGAGTRPSTPPAPGA
ncbi:MAG: NADH-quinone oxidoreductase subunit C [Nitrospirae bacterium]|nr:NADH-quinone oxidoreductase subunit C [Nitrospirota bacterium]